MDKLRHLLLAPLDRVLPVVAVEALPLADALVSSSTTSAVAVAAVLRTRNFSSPGTRTSFHAGVQVASDVLLPH